MLRKLYDWTVAKAEHPHSERWLAAISCMESSFFPIPPHPLLGLMCLARPDKAIRFAIITTIASVVGALIGYAIGFFLYETVGKALLAAIGLADDFPIAACYLRTYDVEIIILAGTTPVPFKLLTITAGFIHMALVPFILASIAGRALIFMSVGVLFRIFGARIKLFIDKYLGAVTAVFTVLLVGGFLALSLIGSGETAPDDACAAATLAAPVS
ncbi:YqaA family protein [Croceicoccus sp. F390]|uniref:YqaA family protein n=1 Tax=Croceicoccus esteveae TaxID=3075597 RepID=A0ABU2ZIU1_9SPHN|nr:YqaA family protein [Croceicoccus sp. F390]MDT0576520.1 YqaA family protein [Croceicoccus sp. F390]